MSEEKERGKKKRKSKTKEKKPRVEARPGQNVTSEIATPDGVRNTPFWQRQARNDRANLQLSPVWFAPHHRKKIKERAKSEGAVMEHG
ncbi:hypothetical protein TRV_03581, partial [Trichophyton verrucosum HKI 0517]